MSIYVIIVLAWLGLALLSWSWLASAARADRDGGEQPPVPPRTHTHA